MLQKELAISYQWKTYAQHLRSLLPRWKTENAEKKSCSYNQKPPNRHDFCTSFATELIHQACHVSFKIQPSLGFSWCFFNKALSHFSTCRTRFMVTRWSSLMSGWKVKFNWFELELVQNSFFLRFNWFEILFFLWDLKGDHFWDPPISFPTSHFRRPSSSDSVAPPVAANRSRDPLGRSTSCGPATAEPPEKKRQTMGPMS